MPVACLIGRGKVHTHPNASGMDVGGCVFVHVQKRVYMTSKVYTNNKKVQHHWFNSDKELIYLSTVS